MPRILKSGDNSSPILRSLAAAALIAVLISGPLAGIAGAQSDADIRKQNQQLNTKVQDLEKELEAAKKEAAAMKQRVTDLEQQLAALRRGGPSATTQPAPLLPGPVSIDENVANASPRALFNAIVASYSNAVSGMEPGRAGEPRRKAYLKKLDGWKAMMDRQFRGPIIWHVRMVGDQPVTERSRIVKLMAVDPQTGTELGSAFDVVLSRFISDRLAQAESRGDLGVMVLRGTLVPSVTINENRDSKGVFDNPPFIGPFAEFRFAVDAKSLLPVTDDQKEQPESPAKPAATTKPAKP